MYSLRQMQIEGKVCEQVDVRLLEQVYPREAIEQSVGQSQPWTNKRRRVRHSTLLSLVWWLLLLGLWGHLNQRQVWDKLTGLRRDLTGRRSERLSASALSARREALGYEGLQRLMHTCCLPLARRGELPTAFFGRYRLLAIDGTRFTTPDPPANDAAFGRSRNQYGVGAYPQVRAVLLVECGSHAILDVQLDAYHVSEVHGAHALLEEVEPNSLVLVDAGIFSGAFAQHVRRRRAHLLGPLCAGAWEQLPQRRLWDGSVLVRVPAVTHAVKYPMQADLWVRIISYQLTDARLGPVGKTYRLATTLLNPRTAPALDLLRLYHERWEIELVIDEVKTEQRAGRKVLRSQTPPGIFQELDALFLAHYALRALMVGAAVPAGLDPDRLSFRESLFHLGEVLPFSLLVPAEAEWMGEQLTQRLREPLLPPRRLRITHPEIKQVYRKYKPKKRDRPVPAPFEPHEQFLDFVALLDPLAASPVIQNSA